jgi:hypothetical protein
MTDHLLLYPILALAGFLAGLVDSIAGGGGLISLPVLLAAGLPPHQALGTNKFQSMFGSLTSSHSYLKQRDVTLRAAIWGIIFTAVGAAAGAGIVQLIHADILGWIIPFMLLAILLYIIFSPDLGHVDTVARWRPFFFYLLFGFSIGFYDGFFGPGTGSFWPLAFVLLLGFNLVKATGYTKVMNFTSNVVSFFLFWIGGNIVWIPGLCMAVGEVFGARLGAHLVINRGAKFIRPVFIAVILGTIVKLIYDNLK